MRPDDLRKLGPHQIRRLGPLDYGRVQPPPKPPEGPPAAFQMLADVEGILPSGARQIWRRGLGYRATDDWLFTLASGWVNAGFATWLKR